MIRSLYIAVLSLTFLSSPLSGYGAGSISNLAPRAIIDDDSSSISQAPPLEVEFPQDFLDRLEYRYIAWSDEVSDGMNGIGGIGGVGSKVDPAMLKLSDEEYIARIDAIRSAVPLSYNETVKRCIENYLVNGRPQIASMLGLADYYFPMIEQQLDAACMPLELKYLTIIESAMNVRAFSKAGAAGLWQFMMSTGRAYGLRVDSYIDERFDPYKSTQAAVRYLNDLYGIYEDWILAIAAYNCGPGNVNKAVRRAGGADNFWSIYYYLPRETRSYVPLYIAATYIFNYYEDYGIIPTKPGLPELCDTIMVSDLLSFEQVAAMLDLTVSQIRTLNPQYKVGIIPAGAGREYALRLPYEYVGEFIDKEDEIFAYERSKYFNESSRGSDPSGRIKVNGIPAGGPVGGTKITYVVKAGDVAGTIARRYGVSLANLRAWNKLDSKMTIRVGQKLTIYVPER